MEKKEITACLAAVSDPTRFDILSIVSKSKEICACEILKQLNITQGTLSHHMKALSSCGLVTCLKDGKWCHYKVNRETLKSLAEAISSLTEESDKEEKCSCSD
jgi:ArsR family transcriptional regulator, arsenate/arsenite/antimonite-responsive transcriptional repressor